MLRWWIARLTVVTIRTKLCHHLKVNPRRDKKARIRNLESQRRESLKLTSKCSKLIPSFLSKWLMWQIKTSHNSILNSVRFSASLFRICNLLSMKSSTLTDRRRLMRERESTRRIQQSTTSRETWSALSETRWTSTLLNLSSISLDLSLS